MVVEISSDQFGVVVPIPTRLEVRTVSLLLTSNSPAGSAVPIPTLPPPSTTKCVAVDEPIGAHTGGAIAAPVFKRIAQAAMHDAGVLPELPSRTALSKEPAQGWTVYSPIFKNSQDVDAERFVGLSLRDALDKMHQNESLSGTLSVSGNGLVVRADSHGSDTVGRTFVCEMFE